MTTRAGRCRWSHELGLQNDELFWARGKMYFGSHEKVTYHDDTAQGIWTVSLNGEWREEEY